MASFSSVPVVDVNKDNFLLLWPSLILAIKSCSYIAMDAELSGLGNRKKLMTRSMEDRYQSLANVAKTRSILSLGISCFKVRAQSAVDQSSSETRNPALAFLAQTFNITVLCSEDYTVEPGSLKFLVDHGFDFNKQYASGVSYHRGVDKDEEAEDMQTLRALFSELIKSAKPVVFHNGLVDLVFLYQNFYTELPTSFAQFLSDLCEVFPAGIFDTKYLAEFEVRMQASYLEYVFRKSQRGNAHLASSGQHHVALEFCQYEDNAPFVGYHHCALPSSFTNREERREAQQRVQLCEIYAAHGHCKNGIRCPKSHDPDAIQDADDEREERRKRKRKRRREKRQEGANKDGLPTKKQDMDGEDEGCHGDGEMEDEDAHAPEENQEDGTDKQAESGIGGESQANLPAIGTDKCKDFVETEQRDGRYSESSPRQDTVEGEAEASSSSRTSPKTPPKQMGSHRAGYDAFMTGFIMATVASTIGQRGSSHPAKINGGEDFVEVFHLTESRNRLFLSAKPVPLLIAKSKFAKTSQNHRQKMKRLGLTPA